jgi:uncharacterized repeat protein (TIGR03803 family)
MKLSRHAGKVVLTLATLIAMVLRAGIADARGQAYRVIYDFRGSSDGWEPVGVPAAVKNGDLYAVTRSGGTSNLGTIFKLTAPRTRGGAWSKTVLYEFPGDKGGGYPQSLVVGNDGNLYGVDYGQSIFELRAPTSGNGTWKYVLLYTLNQNNEGASVAGNLVFDARGNLYGATELRGDSGCEQEGCGTVFELKRPTKSGGKWRLSVLYTFTGKPDGAEPFAGVTFDQNGNLYGTTFRGGDFDWGAVYGLQHPAKKGGSWTETVLYSFDQSNDGIISPEGPVTFDKSGKMYGTTALGGDLNCQGGFGCGVVFALSPPDKKEGAWSYATLYAFQGGSDGIDPSGYMVFDSAGNLYGTTQYGGEPNGGIVYRLKLLAYNDGVWTETVLHAFTGSNGDGDLPVSGLTWGKWLDLYGLTAEGGLCQTCGTVFQRQP